MQRQKNETLTIRTTAEINRLLKKSVAPQDVVAISKLGLLHVVGRESFSTAC
jgi:hypothetical protein